MMVIKKETNMLKLQTEVGMDWPSSTSLNILQVISLSIHTNYVTPLKLFYGCTTGLDYIVHIFKFYNFLKLYLYFNVLISHPDVVCLK